ncbi:MAG: MFS transporter [Ignavibacteria bacterium]|nr:MFS transporter [Ignavibacteria bacterium]
MKKSIYFQLSGMMFLEFFIWGAWYVTVGNYMGRIGMTDVIYWAYTVGPIGAIISPFFLGMVADRFFSTEKVLGMLHIIGGVAMFLAPLAAEAGAAGWFIFLLLLHMICYMPTIGLANALAFHHMTEQEKYFPIIRVFGTVGWIVAGILVSAVLGADETGLPLRIAGTAGVVMGLYAYTLPNTTPSPKEKATFREIMGLDALAQLKSPSFVVFIISSFLICIPLSTYYAYAPVFVNFNGILNPGFKMSFGQMSETLFIILLPLFFHFMRIKWILLVGMLAWVLRYVLFSLAAPSGIFWMIMGGIILHGICYDFFFVAGQIYVDKSSTRQIRGQAQGFLVLMTYGAGMLIGAQISGWLHNGIVTSTGPDAAAQWQTFWAIPAAFGAIIMIVFSVFFKNSSSSAPENGTQTA